ncbi:MAG: 4Fe-4S binding protein [Spirochaetes bacterium]|nr:4Fe-4S binding protein [Spirochaetota bacterium]
MKELVVISGKGGTGKTSIVGALSAIAENKAMADCDVDASDLHLILSPTIRKNEQFTSGFIAEINKNECSACGKCIDLCRFNAITDDFVVDRFSCEGCGVCAYFCPKEAITLNENIAGEWFISDTRYGPMVHARLGFAQGNSGKLVSLVRKEANEIAKNNNLDLIITDGSPGIGCPVIASLTGASLILVVTEPSVSGIHDMKRIAELTNHFKIKTLVCINKYDLSNENAQQIEDYCKKNNIEVVAKIPYDTDFVKAQIEGETILQYSDGEASKEIRNMWGKIKTIIMQ